MGFGYKKALRAGFLFWGMVLHLSLFTAFAQDNVSDFSKEHEITGTENEARPQWVADAIEMAEFIETNELIIKANSYAEYEKLVLAAPSEEKLDRLYGLVIDSMFVGSTEVTEKYMPIYVEEIERSKSAEHQQALNVLEIAAKGFADWSYEETISALEDIAFEPETLPFTSIRALSIAGYFYGYSGNTDHIVKTIRKMEQIAESAPDNQFMESEVIGLKGFAAVFTNDPEQMVKYTIKSLQLAYQAEQLIFGDITTGNFTHLIMEYADVKSIDKIDAINQRVAYLAGDNSAIFRAYTTCGESAVRKLRTVRALQCLGAAEKYRIKNSQVSVRYNLFSSIAHARDGNPKKARAFLETLHSIPDVHTSAYFKKDGEWAKSEVLHSEEKYLEAYDGLRDHFSRQVSEQKTELGEVTKSLRLYGEERAAFQDEKNKILARQDVLQKGVISRQKIMIVLSALLFVGMVIFAWLQKLSAAKLQAARKTTILANKTIRKEARTDQLTRIGNRRAFYEYCNEISEKPECSALTLAILDLDGFKQINDTFGHEAGDMLIVETSQRLKKALKGKGRVFRLGGDEFAIVFLPQDDECLSVFQSCLEEALEGSVEFSSKSINIVASVGSVKLEGEHLKPLNFLNQADYALYKAKELRGTSFYVFSETDFQNITRENQIAEDVLWNLETSDFVMFGQVVVNTANGRYRPFGVEALLRAQTREGDIIKPEDFVRHAVSAGKCNLLTRQSLLKSIRMIQDSKLECLLLFNLSREQFTSPHLLEVIVEILFETNFPGHQLVIELSEKTLDHDLVFATETLKALRQLDVKIALDDFGSANTGFSSLLEFDFDMIKTDRNFLSSAMESDRSKYLMLNLMKLSKKLNIPCVIEGLETAAEVSFVKRLGGKILQGYIFGRPEEMPKFRTICHSVDLPEMDDKNLNRSSKKIA